MPGFEGAFIWMTFGLVALIAVAAALVWGFARLFGRKLGFPVMFFLVIGLIIAIDRGAMWFMESSAQQERSSQPPPQQQPAREAPPLMAR